VGSRQTEQLHWRSRQRIVTTVKESVLKTEMTGLESQEADAPTDNFVHVYGRSDPSDDREATVFLRSLCVFFGSRNTTRQTLPTSVKLTHLSMYDRRDGVSERAD
jgi:hypothetical protein